MDIHNCVVLSPLAFTLLQLKAGRTRGQMAPSKMIKIFKEIISYACINIFHKKGHWFKIWMEFLRPLLAKIESICQQPQVSGTHPSSGVPERMTWGWWGGMAMIGLNTAPCDTPDDTAALFDFLASPTTLCGQRNYAYTREKCHEYHALCWMFGVDEGVYQRLLQNL